MQNMSSNNIQARMKSSNSIKRAEKNYGTLNKPLLDDPLENQSSES